MDDLDFSEEEIQEQLAALGYKNIPKHRLCEFKQDLDDLVRRGEWKSFASPAQINTAKSQTAAAQPSPPAFTKEKVGRCHFGSSAEGFFLHARKVDHDRRVLTACQNRDYEQQQGRWDSYAQHSVALNLRLPPGAPGRLQVEPDPEESLQPPLNDSYMSTPDSHTSTPDSHRGRFIKRKVLRKHKGRSLVCDESVYSEEAVRLRRALTSAGVVSTHKMYSAQWDEDKSSLSSSFWSDGGRQEGEEVGEGDLEPVGNGEESHRVASGEEEEVIGEEDTKALGVSEDSYREASGEVEVERGIRVEDSKPVTDAKDSLQEASEKEEEEEDSNPLSDSDDSLQEDSEKEEDSNPLSDSGDSYQEDSEEMISEEESKPVDDVDDHLQETLKEEEDPKPPGNSEEIEHVISEEESKSAGNVKDHLQQSSEKEKDSNTLSDSEDSYQEDSEEEDDSKPVTDAEDYLQAASEEEDSNPLSDSGDSHQEDSEEIEQMISEEESKPVDDVDDHLQETLKEEEDPKPPGNSEDIEHVISEEESKSVADVKDYLQESSEKEEDSNPLSDSEESYQEDSEAEEMEIERVISVEESKPVGDADDHLQEPSKEEEEDSNPPGDSEDRYQEASEEEKPELNNQVNIIGGSLEGGDDDDEEECCSSSSDSPAPSLMTSGYGTYKPEELEGGDDQDSRGDLSEMRDDEEDDRSLSSFGWFDLKPGETEPTEVRPMSVLANGEPETRRDDDLHHEVTEEDRDQAREEKFEVHLHEVTSGEQQFVNTVVEKKVDVTSSAGGRDDELLEEDVQDRKKEKDIEDKVELEDPDESSSNKDIKFIDSKADFSHMRFDKMCVDWEGNLRQKKKKKKKKKKKEKTASSLEEQLADLHLSSTARRDFETEIEDVGGQTDGQSSETDGVSLSAFESYLRGMTRTQSDGDLRPKPKSFIRPAMSQQTIKKTDPVAKYFKYKQLWEMFQLPGEKDRRSLRWEIKERLAYRPPPPKPRRVYAPNGYIVPTEKKRSALRWEIRNDLANRLLPHKFSSQC